jgi:hypothetical protein
VRTHLDRALALRLPTARAITAPILAIASLACASPTTTTIREAPGALRASIAVYALSRGKGVPPPAREALGKVRDFVAPLRQQGQVTRIDETRLGLEGETRLCVEFKDAAAARDAIARIREITRDVELLNVEEEPCEKR